MQLFTGAVPGAAYPITAFCSQATVNKAVTFTLHSNAFGICTDNTPPDDKFIIEYVYAADQYGHNINARAVGETMPLQARMYFLREGVMIKDVPVTCGDNSGTCKDAKVGSKAYDEDTDFKTASMTFGGDDNLGKPMGNGVYKKVDYKVEKLGPNDVSIHGTATAATSKEYTKIGCDGNTIICSPVTEEVKGDQTITMQVYGVAITVPPKILVMVDQEGYTLSDIPITYTILPDTGPDKYQAATAYVAIMKRLSKDQTEPLVFIPAETSGEGKATLSRGFWFNLDPTATYTYEAQVILNYGTGVEIRSERVNLELVESFIQITLGLTKQLRVDPYPENPTLLKITAGDPSNMTLDWGLDKRNIKYYDNGRIEGNGLFRAIHLNKEDCNCEISVKAVNDQNKVGVTSMVVLKPDKLGDTNKQYDILIISAADKYGVSPQLIKAMIRQESNFDPNATRYEPFFDRQYVQNNPLFANSFYRINTGPTI